MALSWAIISDGPGGCINDQEVTADRVPLQLLEEHKGGLGCTILSTNEGNTMEHEPGVTLLGYKFGSRSKWGGKDRAVAIDLVISRVTSEYKNEIVVELRTPSPREESDQGGSSGMELVHRCPKGANDVFRLLLGLMGGNALRAGLYSKFRDVLGCLVCRTSSRAGCRRSGSGGCGLGHRRRGWMVD